MIMVVVAHLLTNVTLIVSRAYIFSLIFCLVFRSFVLCRLLMID